MPERPQWYWDAAVARFRNQRGRFVAQETVLKALRASEHAARTEARVLARQVARKQIAPNEFREAMRELIKQEHVRQALVGNGGLRNMDPAAWGRIGGNIGNQYKYLDNFTTDLVTKDLTEAQIAARAQMYANSAKMEFHAAWHDANALSDEMAAVRWVMTPAEHCEDCIAFANLGWQLMRDDPFGGAVPGDGTTACGTNCRCHLEYGPRSRVE